MRITRYLTAACALAAVCGSLALSAQAAPPPSSLRAYSCSPNLQPLLRGLNITAYMHTLPGTQHLRMRFDLQRARTRTGRYRAVAGRNLGNWISPTDPTLGRQPADSWSVNHPVVGVSRPGYYRYRVAFEWIGTHSRVLASSTRTSPVCALLELRPDLLVSGIPTVTPVANHPTRSVYTIAIRNRGVTAAGPFGLQLVVGGGTPVTRTLTGLGAHGTRRVRVIAPTCTAGEAITATADPTQQIPDYDPANNSLTITCPAAG